MARTPTRFAGPALVTNSAATKYTVPGSTVALVRAIHVSNPTALRWTSRCPSGRTLRGRGCTTHTHHC